MVSFVEYHCGSFYFAFFLNEMFLKPVHMDLKMIRLYGGGTYHSDSPPRDEVKTNQTNKHRNIFIFQYIWA